MVNEDASAAAFRQWVAKRELRFKQIVLEELPFLEQVRVLAGAAPFVVSRIMTSARWLRG